MYYVLHGEDEFSRSEQVNRLREKMGDPQFAELNTTHIDGRKATLNALQHACDAVPFLADKRLIIVEGMLARFDPRRRKTEDDAGEETEAANPELAKELADYLARLPDTTRLVFVESKKLADNNPILKRAAADKKNAYAKEFEKLKPHALPKWIQDRVKAKGGAMELSAVNELAEHVGTDLRLLDNEIEKLLTYCANSQVADPSTVLRQAQEGSPGQAPATSAKVTADDVRALVASVQESNVFGLVDALGRRETDVALDLLHKQLDQNAQPPYLLVMITRQFRLLLQMKDLAARGSTLNAAREQLKLHPFVAQKTWTQASNFTLPRLEETYRKLLDTDIAIKTGRSEPVVALEVLIVELTR